MSLRKRWKDEEKTESWAFRITQHTQCIYVWGIQAYENYLEKKNRKKETIKGREIVKVI